MPGLFRFAAIFLVLTSAPLRAQDAPKYFGPFVSDPRFPAVLILNGEIGPSATFDFRQAILEEDVLTLVLNSPGGAILPALEVAAIAADKGVETVLPEGATCASACAFIFLAGQTRYAAGQLGVHQFYALNDELELGSVTRGETQDLAGTIIKYLDSFETPSAVYIRMLGTPPDQMYWFPQDELLSEGIVTGPLEFFPTIPFDSYETTVTIEPPQVAAQPTPEADPEIEAEEDADPLPKETPDPDPADAVAQPAPEQELEETARVSQPSFDCRLAGTPTERAICADAEIGDKDSLMASMYLRLRADATATLRQQLLDSQRAFLRTRNACGADVACLHQVYDARIAVLNDS